LRALWGTVPAGESITGSSLFRSSGIKLDCEPERRTGHVTPAFSWRSPPRPAIQLLDLARVQQGISVTSCACSIPPPSPAYNTI